MNVCVDVAPSRVVRDKSTCGGRAYKVVSGSLNALVAEGNMAD